MEKKKPSFMIEDPQIADKVRKIEEVVGNDGRVDVRIDRRRGKIKQVAVTVIFKKEVDKSADVIDSELTQRAGTKSQGTLMFTLVHEPGWPNNSLGYNFGTVMKDEDMAIEVVKYPDTTFEFKVSGLFGTTFVFRRPMPPCEKNECHVMFTWKDGVISLHLNGHLEEAKSVNVSELKEKPAQSASMNRRIPKTLEQRMQDCETHLFFLRDALRLYPSQPDRFKQIAAELRVLVCETKNNHPLLLELMEELGFSCGPVPLREYVEKKLALYLAPYEYTYRDLVLKVAQQLGSSHEDLSVEEPLAKMQNMVLGQAQGHVAPLIPFANLVFKVGEAFLLYLIDHHNYTGRYVCKATPEERERAE